MKRFARELASRAEPDFSFQSRVSMEDLVRPLEVGRFPDEKMFANYGQFREMFDLMDYVAAQYKYRFDQDDPLSGLYASFVSLVGIARYQCPDSAEFGITGTCLVLLRATNDLNSVPTEKVASFVDKLKQHAIQNSQYLWNPAWVVVSLATTALALTSRPSAKSDWGKELSDMICSAEWHTTLAEVKSGAVCTDELQAMETLFELCGTIE